MLGSHLRATLSETTVWGGHGQRSMQIRKTTVGEEHGWWWDRRSGNISSPSWPPTRFPVRPSPLVGNHSWWDALASYDDSLHAAAFDAMVLPATI
ncbi:hypothetical protein TIFTF001_014210 [Ficus carica]|uniref:Uncharacterized protein n=1 Tax=Ficus carica TaxID=3494 RepID=A0AA88A5N5_FICCA|nr:hypothetical protein TIFTF001_014210 [Ficus carica]